MYNFNRLAGRIISICSANHQRHAAWIEYHTLAPLSECTQGAGVRGSEEMLI